MLIFILLIFSRLLIHCKNIALYISNFVKGTWCIGCFGRWPYFHPQK